MEVKRTTTVILSLKDGSKKQFLMTSDERKAEHIISILKAWEKTPQRVYVSDNQIEVSSGQKIQRIKVGEQAIPISWERQQYYIVVVNEEKITLACYDAIELIIRNNGAVQARGAEPVQAKAIIQAHQAKEVRRAKEAERAGRAGRAEHVEKAIAANIKNAIVVALARNHVRR
jgi:hypothetical protein